MAGPTGPLSPYAGQDVDPYTNMPAGGDNANAYTGDQNVNPYECFQTAASSTGVPTNTSQWPGSSGPADGSNSGGSADGQNFDDLIDYWKDAQAAEQSQRQASNVTMATGESTGSQNVDAPVADDASAAPLYPSTFTPFQDPDNPENWGTLITVYTGLDTAIKEAVGGSASEAIQNGSLQPGGIRDVLSGTDWMSLLDPQTSQPAPAAAPIGASSTPAPNAPPTPVARQSGWESSDNQDGLLAVAAKG